MEPRFYAGQRVTVPESHGIRIAGTVAYVRMLGPDYREPACVSVVLDNRKGNPNYTGSTYLPAQVEPMTEDK